MSERKFSGEQMLAKADVYQLRLSGLILAALVHKGILTNEQVRGLLADVSQAMPADFPLRAAVDAMLPEFPG